MRLTKENTTSWSKTRFDGYGRTIETENSEGVLTKTTFDVINRVVFLSYPYRGAVLGDTLQNDGLGRVVKTTHPDSTLTTTAYNGLTVTTTNENNRSWVADFEAFGNPSDRRLIRVTDPNGAQSQYQYDVINNLLVADEPGLTSDRTYVYDSRRFK